MQSPHHNAEERFRNKKTALLFTQRTGYSRGTTSVRRGLTVRALTELLPIGARS